MFVSRDQREGKGRVEIGGPGNGSTTYLVVVQSKTGVQGSCYGQGCEGECIHSCWSKQHRGGGSVQIGFYKES